MVVHHYRTLFQSIILIGVLLLAFISYKTVSSKQTKPNIILIVTDDQGWGDLGVNGNPTVQTPRIDQLAAEGAQFSRFYVSPVCSPTRAEILTGRYHPRGGVYSTSQGGERLDLDESTIADLFQSQGYRTAAYGKWHSGSQPPYHPNNRGFDEFYGFCSGHWGNYFSPMLERNGAVIKGDGFIIDDLTNNAMEYIAESSNEPFFVHLAYNTPHSPMQVPDQWWNKYKNAPIDPHRYADQEQADKTRAAWALCENIDWNVGRLMDQLNNLRILDNTIIIYMSDNGPNGWRWNDGLKGIKGHTDEGGVRSPFIIYWKDQWQARIIDNIAGAIDILPSLADLADIPITSQKSLDGLSLKPLLMDPNQSWTDRYIFSHWRGNVSVRNQQYMLDKDNQLFDLTNDPGQLAPITSMDDEVHAKFISAKNQWADTVLKELNTSRKEVFPVGFAGSRFTHLPARDASASGNIKRSNRWPNSSYFTNWSDSRDSISWNCDILNSGMYNATVYYTSKPSAIGSVLSLHQGNNAVRSNITVAHDPPFDGAQYDRYPREESFEKDFKALEMGEIHLDKGLHSVFLKVGDIKGSGSIDFRLLVLEIVN
jgi:arylsulfatase A-like enzyme